MNVQTDRYTDRQTHRQMEFTDITYMWGLLRLAPIKILYNNTLLCVCAVLQMA